MQEAVHHLLDIGRRALPMIPVVFCIDNYVGTAKAVGGRSMQPTFNARGKETTDVVVLDRWTARRLAFRRGDVVVLASPHAPEELMTKRVLGLAGDWVRARPDSIHSGEVLQVPRGHIWIEGDNPNASKDSNAFGAVPVALVEARVCFKLWPPREAGFVERREIAADRLVYRGRSDSAAASLSSGMLPWHLPAQQRRT